MIACTRAIKSLYLTEFDKILRRFVTSSSYLFSQEHEGREFENYWSLNISFVTFTYFLFI
jgi:hypothetical protein